MQTTRTPEHPIDAVFLNRWSPRAYDASAMDESDLLRMLEAARWAPSAYNLQPWRFLYSLRKDAHWNHYLALLDPFNADWAQHASALIFVLSNSLRPGNDHHADSISRSHSFDAGAAWAQLALQATSLGYQAHAMAGIYFDQVTETLAIPEQYRVEIAIAVGHQSDPSGLPQALQKREQPSQRLPLNQIAFAGEFPQ